MPGLNDDIEDGLDSGFDPSSMMGLEAPQSNEPKKDITLVTPVDGGGKDIPADISDEMKTTEPGVLPNLDAKIALVEEGRTKVVELKEVESMIEGHGGVSQESASLIQHLTGSFFHSKLSEKEFTSLPSRTNLAVTSNFLKNRIAQEQASLFGNVKVFTSEPLEEMKLFQHHITHIYTPYVKEQTFMLQREFEDVISNIEASKNTVLPSGNEFVNIATTRLNQLMLKGVQFGDAVGKENTLPDNFTKSVDLIRSLFDCPKFTELFAAMLEERDIDDMTGSEPFIPNTPNLIELVSLYKGNKILRALDELENTVKVVINNFADLGRTIEDCGEDFDKLNNCLLDNAERIKNLSSTISLLHGFSKKLIALNFAMRNVFTLLKYCL